MNPLERLPPGLEMLSVLFSGLSIEKVVEESVNIASDSALETAQPIPEYRSTSLLESFFPTASREARELYDDTGVMSNLYQDDFSRVPICLQDQAFMLQVFMKQRSTDQVFFQKTLEKRIRLASLEANRVSFSRSTDHAQHLFRAFMNLLQMPCEGVEPFDQDLFDFCTIQSEVNKLSKGTTLLQANVQRSDPDTKDASEFVKLFVKTQVKAKSETINVPGKAGQTLALFQDRLLMLLGPWARYLSTKIRERLPSTVFWHNRTSLSDLDAFVKEEWADRDSTTADATFYDYHQGAPGLLFEQMLFERFGCPPDLLREYIRTKLDTTCFLGHMVIMRLTGEWFTLDGNTYYNLADFLLRHPQCLANLLAPKGDPTRRALLVVGDDRTYNDVVEDPGTSFRFARTSPPQKYEVTRISSFVSLLVTPRGVIKDPILLMLRLHYHEVSGRLPMVIASYYLEHLIGLELIRNTPEWFTAEQIEAFDRNCRSFCRHKQHIPSFMLGTSTAIQTPLYKLFSPDRRPLFLRLRRAYLARDPSFSQLLFSLGDNWDEALTLKVLNVFNLYSSQHDLLRPAFHSQVLSECRYQFPRA
jgi:hypothetical protein